MSDQLVPAIVVLNKNYFLRDSLSAAPVGASAFTISVLKTLHEAQILGGIVLYYRDEGLSEVQLDVESSYWVQIPVVTVSFNFHMAERSISSALKKAFHYTIRQTTYRNPRRIVYYQTDTLLQYHPRGVQFCVTHHGPFVEQFSQCFSEPVARLAFGGHPNKVNVLCRQQQTGINRLLYDRFGTVFAHSGLQQRFLEDQGIQSSRFKRLRAPIGTPRCDDATVLPKVIKEFIYEAEILLFTAVARLDYFKNIDLMVAAGIELLNRGVPVKVLVVGDTASDDTRRHALLKTVPMSERRSFLVVPRLSKDQLYALFASTQDNGIFLCSSRYETLGITPLESAASGVATLIAESPTVEALAYIPHSCRVDPTPAAIASKVQMVHHTGIQDWARKEAIHVRRETSFDNFRDDLLRAWRDISQSGIRRYWNDLLFVSRNLRKGKSVINKAEKYGFDVTGLRQY